jgi:DNA-binding transcriptional ArsR family regulator
MSPSAPVPEAVDRLVHEPARLAILSRLASSEAGRASFTELRDELGLSAGNLSVQLRNLEEAGYLRVEKSFRGKKPYTEVALEARGEEALAAYISRMESILASLKAGLAEPAGDGRGIGDIS